MLHIFTTNGTGKVLSVPFFQDDITLELIRHTEWIQADGDELDKIINLYTKAISVLFINDSRVIVFPSIPLADKTDRQRWYGDIARTILMNLI